MAKSDYQLYLKSKHSKFNTPVEIINDVVKEATGSEVKHLEKVILGEVNEVYDIISQGGKSLIVRISRSRNPRFVAESWAISKAREVGVPAPEILLIATKQDLEQTLTFCVEVKLPGDPLSIIPWQEKDRLKKFVVQSGGILAKIHSVTPDGFGELKGNGEGKQDTWKDYIMEIDDEREEILASAGKTGLLNTDVERGFAILRENLNMFESVTPHLLHGDFSVKHILFKNEAITGIIDFESCRSGDPVWDFAWWSYFFGQDLPVEWLKEGYGILDPDFDKKLAIYRLRLGLSLVHYYESENNISGMKHTKEKLLKDLNVI